MDKNLPHATPKKDANPEPKVSKDELPEGDLNKVTGGKIVHGDMQIQKYVDKATPLFL